MFIKLGESDSYTNYAIRIPYIAIINLIGFISGSNPVDFYQSVLFLKGWCLDVIETGWVIGIRAWRTHLRNFNFLNSKIYIFLKRLPLNFSEYLEY